MKRNITHKTMTALLATVLAAAGLSGCAGGKDAGGTGSGSGAASGDGKAEGKVTVQLWNHYTGDKAAVLDQMVSAFNASQNEITVKALSNQDPQKQLTAISGGSAPDLMFTFWNNIGPWSEAGAVLNLDDFVKQANFDTKKIIPAALERMKVDGKVYGFPISMSMASRLYYNKKMFQDAGISKPPETLEEMFEVSKKLTKKDGKNGYEQVGFIPDYPWIDNVFWPIIFGGSWDDGKGKLTAAQKANVDAIAYQTEYYKEFGSEGISKFKSGMGKADTPQDPLVTSKLGMMIGWENMYNDKRGEGGAIGVAPFPYPKERPELKNAGMVSPVAMFIPAKAKNKEAAWKVMQYFLSEDVQIEYATKAKTIPVLLSALDNPKLTKNEATKSLWEFYESAKSANLNGFPNSVYINEYLQALNEETEKALKGQITPQQAMDNVVAKIQPKADKASKK
ncbi:ABC transporter substrate-binding protein [Paenibacillus elgii]|uniref:ABC transporter substrate-binding protein n=1 Tax=Paenibacillus elgii TaxID=189691 RepID=A0A163XZF7_9BACL|nr:ABC transporter substrate-binding protein [Paenibacillus elgii]KZE78681.1 ABC transporter substrate-binding protein [Paenibacillus elgii]